MEEKKQFRVSPSGAGKRIDLFLAEELPDCSRSRWQRLIRSGMVTVGGEPVKPHHRLKEGEEIEAELPSAEEFLPPSPFLPLDIIHRDEDILVVNKPAGIIVHPVKAGRDGTLLNAILFHSPPLSSRGGPLRRGIVHRLDKDTSGVLVVARNDRAHLHLARKFKQRKVSKEYLALVFGHPPRDRGEVSYPIGRNRRRRTTMVVRYLGGKAALTAYEVRERFPDCALLLLRPSTGRTHQIRLHLARLGCPVLGDRQYGRPGLARADELEVKRQMLHAYRLRFEHPANGKNVEFIAPLPDDMKEVLTRLRASE